jgi:uncharacterized membrane protein YeaQ/YmgE (transglycosylase-associated protein family)
MKEAAQEALRYLQENLFLALLLAIVAGFAAWKTAAYGRKGNPVLYFVVGLLGLSLGQYAILYFGFKGIIDDLDAFRFFFDLLAAYMGAFVIAWLINVVKPL